MHHRRNSCARRIDSAWRFGAIIASIGLMAGVTPAFAQEEGPAPAQASTSSSGLGDIVVTARRREEALQSVPISVQAFSGEALSKQNVQDANDLQKLVPALTTYQQARDEVTMSIRGQSSSGASAQGQNPRVTAYFSQVPLQTGDNGPGKFFDLQNVQILKGPQGTLFGRNSTGGAALYEPTRPSQNFGGYVNLQYGRFNDRQIEGAINVPAGDTLSFRFAGKAAKRDGFTKTEYYAPGATTPKHQKLDDRNYFGLRGSMLWTPSDRFENFLMVDYTKSSTNGSSQQIAGIDATKTFAANINRLPGGGLNTAQPIRLSLGGPYVSLAQFSTNPAQYYAQAVADGAVAYFPNPATQNAVAWQQQMGPRYSRTSVDAVSKAIGWGITNISTFNISDNLTLKNIFGYRRFKQNSRYDMDGTAFPLLDQITPDGHWATNLRQISNETQLQGQALDGALDFTLGAFLLWSSSPKPQYLVQMNLGTPSLSISDPKERSQAVFGQVSYDFSNVGAEGLKLTAGYRYTHDFRSVTSANYRDSSATLANGYKFSLAPATCNLLAGCPTSIKASFNASSYNIGLDYQVNPQTLLYVTHRRGYRAGGLNPQAYNFGMQYGPETVTDFEAGLKTDFAVGGMDGRFNFAAFHSIQKDAQISQPFSTTHPVTGAPSLVNLIVNAAKAKVKGIEADLTLKPIENLTLGASYSYTDAKYTKVVDAQTGAIITGHPFAFLAKHRLNLSANLVVPLSDTAGELSFGANWAYSSKYSLSVTKDPLGVENGYNQLDLRADWNNIAGQDGLSLGVFVNNVTKEVYKIGGVPIYTTLGSTSLLFSEPRTWGLQLRYRFGD
ncbi:TonB-dependent receptor [Caenibius tardaugens]|nr:TonB-dependent receptor [Caenibius tardaugens]